MSKGITDPTTGKTYTYKGFVPLRRISDVCKRDHQGCLLDPSLLQSSRIDFDDIKKFACLCSCHFD